MSGEPSDISDYLSIRFAFDVISTAVTSGKRKNCREVGEEMNANTGMAAAGPASVVIVCCRGGKPPSLTTLRDLILKILNR
jgi:hypothetical protein